jgi:hypothetical protein
MMKTLLTLALTLASMAAFADTQSTCTVPAQQQARSMVAINSGTTPEKIQIVNLSSRKLPGSGGLKFSVQTLDGNGIPVEIKVDAFENAMGTCTTLKLEVGTAG